MHTTADQQALTPQPALKGAPPSQGRARPPVVSFTLSPQQATAFLPGNHGETLDACLFQGGLGSGKTTLGVIMGLDYATRYPGSRGLVGAANYTLLRDTTRLAWNDMVWDIEADIAIANAHTARDVRRAEMMRRARKTKFFPGEERGKNFVRAWTKIPDNLILTNGSEVWFRHLDDFERLKSTEFDWVHIEEASQIPYVAFKMLIGRLRSGPSRARNFERYRIMLTTNPEIFPGWLTKEFVDKVSNGTHPNYRRVVAPTRSNPGVTDDYISEIMRTSTPEEVRMFLEGLTGSGGVGAYSTFDRALHVVPIDVMRSRLGLHLPDSRLPLILAWDFNVTPLCVVIAQEIRGVTYVIDEIILRNARTHDMCRAILDRYPARDGSMVTRDGYAYDIFGDPAGNARNTSATQTDYQIIRQAFPLAQYFISRSAPTQKDRVESVNVRLRNALGETKLFVAKHCEELIGDLSGVKWLTAGGRSSGEGFSLDKSDPDRTHTSDALGYYIAYRYPLHRGKVCIEAGY